jgi:hypothetical protein
MPNMDQICGACREVVDPSDPKVIYAVELKYALTFGDAEPEPLEGLGVFFHEVHFPTESPAYREKEKPEGFHGN